MTERPAVARLLADLEALDPKGEAVGRRAELVDGCLEELFAAAGAPAGTALVATGGYGRADLAPYSDLDLLLLHRGTEDGPLLDLAERLLYPLWDAGFDVGHAVRTVEECLALAEERFDTGTAMLDARRVAGDAGLVAELVSALRAWAGRDPRAFAERLLREAGVRRERYGATTHLLEPDLKQGVGGLRDGHSLRWLAVALGCDDADRPAGLEREGLLRGEERRTLAQAEAFVSLVRNEAHRTAGRRQDRLLLDLQPRVAQALGFRDEPTLPAADGLMRAVFERARQIEHVAGLVFERLLREGVPDREPDPLPTPERVLGVFADVAEGRLAPTPALLDRVERAGLPEEIAWTDATREAFLRILRAGDGGIRALEALDRLDLLVRFVPEWGPVRCRPQRDPYHRFTVDVHLLEALREMGRLLAGDVDDDPVAIEALGAVRDRDALLVGALLHDCGKTGEGGHVRVGARVAATALGRMRLPGGTRDLAMFMVERHLLLPDTATRRDLGDDDLVLGVAATVGDQERLAALYLLAVADAVATGPAARTAWRQTLLRELVAKVQHVLERGEIGEEAAGRLAARADAVRERLDGEDPADVERFLERMPRTYLLAVEPEAAARHFRLVASRPGEAELRTAEGPGAGPGTYEVTVVAADRPGLLSAIAGALTLAGLSILAAQVFTTSDGVALDLFEVEGAFEPEVTEERWAVFRRALAEAVTRGPSELERRLADKRRHYPPPRSHVPVEVEIDNRASDFFTVIEVGAADRIGLLHDVTRALADLGLDVHLAKVATYGERVIDAFYVRDEVGSKVDDPERVAEIERALSTRVGG